ALHGQSRVARVLLREASGGTRYRAPAVPLARGRDAELLIQLLGQGHREPLRVLSDRRELSGVSRQIDRQSLGDPTQTAQDLPRDRGHCVRVELVHEPGPEATL